MWPPEPVRDQIERLASDRIERAIQIERFNMRGSHFRGVYEGGDQERDLAKTNFDAAAVAAAWPRTGALLRAFARKWVEEATRGDVEAARRRLKS